MKIHLWDADPRYKTDPAYPTNMGSFGIVIHGLNDGLRELGYYAEPDQADYVGTVEGVGLNFQYKNKLSFIINVWDQINVIPNELLEIQKRTNQTIFGLSNQVTNLWRKFGVPAETVMPGVSVEFYKQSVPKADKFTAIFDSFANVRSGFELAIHAFYNAFCGNKNVQLIIKNTTDSKKFCEVVEYYKSLGVNILFINERLSFEQMRDLYSMSHISLNVMRHSSWGLNVQMAAACNCLPLLGDFCPSNEMDVGVLLKPSQEIFIDEILQNLIDFWGLHNAYGNFTYSERPTFYYYKLDEYTNFLREIYDQWDSKYSKIDNRKPLLNDKWRWKTAAQNLINYLEL